MSIFVQPDYSREFKCIADRCTDTCCQGWEIDVDEESVEKYGRLDTALGADIRENVYTDEFGAHFKLKKGDRCPFLRDDGLCRMIIEGGEELLCSICREHPRFYSVFTGRTEMGYGLCCEEACRLLCRHKDGIRLLIDGSCTETDELAALMLNARELAFNIIRNRSCDIFTRMQILSQSFSADADALLLTDKTEQTLSVMAELEPFDETWKPLVNELTEAPYAFCRNSPIEDHIIENLLFYFVYRYMTKAYTDDYSYSACVGFAVLSTRFICASLELARRNAQLDETRVVDVIKNYSKQVEYCEENVIAILNMLEGDTCVQNIL